nr:hypothetical protein CFP56_66535 [Quercus suber]
MKQSVESNALLDQNPDLCRYGSITILEGDLYLLSLVVKISLNPAAPATRLSVKEGPAKTSTPVDLILMRDSLGARDDYRSACCSLRRS